LSSKHKDIVYGVAGCTFSIFCLIYLIPAHVKANTNFAVGVKTIPQLAVSMIGIASLALVIMRVRELPDKSILFKKENYNANWNDLLRQVIFLIAMIVYIQLLPVVGFVIASILFSFGMMYYFGSENLAKNIAVAVSFSAIVYLLFSRVFHVSLSSGLLPF